MYDLVSKIQELVKALSSIKPPQANSLVPAIKAPTLKPLSMPPMTSSGPSKIPGVEPPNNKDPKKVEQQLKNPQPKKPKLEMIKFDSNGQWSLKDN